MAAHHSTADTWSGAFVVGQIKSDRADCCFGLKPAVDRPTRRGVKGLAGRTNVGSIEKLTCAAILPFLCNQLLCPRSRRCQNFVGKFGVACGACGHHSADSPAQFAVSLASIQHRDMIAPLLKLVRQRFPSVLRAIADGGYQGPATATSVLDEAGIPFEIVKRSDDGSGFKILPNRWIVKRIFGWLGRYRQLAKNFENLTRSHAAFFILAMIRLIRRRIVRAREAS